MLDSKKIPQTLCKERNNENTNILLVMPKSQTLLGDSDFLPVGILYISSSLKKAGLNVIALNLIGEDEDKIESLLKENITKYDIDIVASGELVSNYKELKKVIDISKEIKSEIVTIIGGGFVTHSPYDAMELITNADYGVIGEGEITDVELIEFLIENKDISLVDGVIFKQDGEFIVTNSRTEIMDLDEIPWPDYEGFNYFEITKKHSYNGFISSSLTTSRSCPFSCTFCSKSGGSKYRQRSLDKVFEEMDYLINNFGVNRFIFSDELFTQNLQRVKDFCEVIKHKNVTWRVWLRISKTLTLDILKMMKEAGCTYISFGLESACNTVLKSMKKFITVEEMFNVLTLTKQAGILSNGCYIFGDTMETVETVNETLDWVINNFELLDDVGLALIVLYPGSALYDKAVAEGKITDTKSFIENGCPLVNVSKMSNEEYLQLQHRLQIVNSQIAKKKFDLEKNLTITRSKTSNEYKLDFICYRCNKMNTFSLSPNTILYMNTNCNYCNAIYRKTGEIFFSYLENFDKYITELLSKTGTAIYGLGELFNSLYQSNSYVRENDIILIDSNEYKQEKGYMNKKVFSLTVIEEKNIDTIICCLRPDNFYIVKDYIIKNHPGVKNVLNIVDVGLNHD